MSEKNGARAATAEHPATPSVAPRFVRAAQTERSRLEGKREQLLHKREEAQAEVERIDRAVGSVDELLELLAPLLAGNGGEPEAAGDDNPAAKRAAGGSDRGQARERDRVHPPDPQPAKE